MKKGENMIEEPKNSKFKEDFKPEFKPELEKKQASENTNEQTKFGDIMRVLDRKKTYIIAG